jgi:hypothetical protein
MKRPFQKVATTYEQQVTLLQQCGMIIDDVTQAWFGLYTFDRELRLLLDDAAAGTSATAPTPRCATTKWLRRNQGQCARK